MNDFFTWLFSNSPISNGILILLGLCLIIIFSIYLVAFIQGREISFWPPKIGGKNEISNKSKKGKSQSKVGNQITNNTPLKWEKPAVVFWLSHDLMLAYHHLVNGGKKEYIMFALNHSLYQAKSLGLLSVSNTGTGKQLEDITEKVSRLSEKEITSIERNTLASEIADIIKAIGTMAELNQPDFQPNPKEGNTQKNSS